MPDHRSGVGERAIIATVIQIRMPLGTPARARTNVTVSPLVQIVATLSAANASALTMPIARKRSAFHRPPA
jgi:hypothetical protein